MIVPFDQQTDRNACVAQQSGDIGEAYQILDDREWFRSVGPRAYLDVKERAKQSNCQASRARGYDRYMSTLTDTAEFRRK